MEQLIKQLDCFQDSLTPALSFVFLCHEFLREKKKEKDLFPWNSEVINLYFTWKKSTFFLQVKFIWKFFNKFNLYNLLRLIYIGGAKIISIVFFFFLNKGEKRDLVTVLWPRCGQIKWKVNHFKQNIFHTLCVFSVAQPCLTLCNPVDCNPAGSSVPGIFQARILEKGAISYSRGSPWHRDWTHVCLFCLLCCQADSLPLHHLRCPFQTLLVS